ncbi:uncharacterized protein LOC129840958 [Salvelinus fontinalis]|uniref:uncharacterized protein LOC129840958 n=1 Tax=Salvelinus fontinalis TaxID=8038 RepID=UPI0024858163|nr:uncharacterized protein LOC129840958 [Salvelinus fontinalis]
MSVIEEEEGKEEEEEKSGEATQESPTMEQTSQAETERKPVGHHARFQSSFSSFKFNFSPISLVDMILTGEEWSPFLSIKDSPAPSPSIYQGYDEGDQLKTGPESRLPNDVQHNHEDIGLSLYEAVSFSQSSPNEIVDNQSVNRQQEVDNNNGTGADAIAVIKPKILLDNDAAEESELDHSRPISKDIHDSVELCKSPIRTQSKDLLDFLCVESLGVLDSSAQKHKIRLSKKRKHRLPGLKKTKTETFNIRCTASKAPEIKFLKPSPPSPTSLPPSSSSCSSPSYVFPSSVFYNIPPSAEEQDPVTSPTQDNLSDKTTESSRKPGSSPKPPLSKFMTVLRDKTKWKLKQ